MKEIGAVTIGKLIEAHYEKDEYKFFGGTKWINCSTISWETYAKRNSIPYTDFNSN